MVRTLLSAIALAVCFSATTLTAQTFLQEDFSTGVGLVPPAGWSAITIGTDPAPWRFDNPGSRALDPPASAPFAISDPDNNPSFNGNTSILRSPAFNATGTSLLNLSFDQQLRDLSSGWSIEVFDGAAWNVVAFQANNTVNANIGYLATPNVVSTMHDVTTAAGGAANAQLRFVYTYGFDWWWAIDNVKIEQPSPIDMAVASIDAPVDDPNACLPPTGLQTVTVTLENQGALPVLNGSLIQVDMSVNAGPITTEFVLLAADLNPNATIQYTFTAQANLPAPGPNTLTVTVVMPGDGDPTDDSISKVLAGAGGLGLTALPYSENFDGAPAQNSTVPPTGWAQDATDATGTDSDWYMHTGNTSSGNTGPIQGDHTSGAGYYAYVEDSTGNHAQVNLLTPCFDLTGAISPIAQFWLFSFNGNPGGPNTQENFMSVDVIAYPGGAVTMDAFGPQGDLGFGTQAAAQWQQQTLNLTPFAGQVVRLRFRGTSNNGGAGNTFYHDQCVDDFSIFEPVATPGQAPRAGMAAFDINTAINLNTATVPSGLGGPYFANVTQGSAMNMSFDGVPGQPIAVVYGALNPTSATYPGGIGQFDIGGPGVDPNGIPLNIAVFVNAIGWAQAGFPGFPIDAMFFTGAAGTLNISFLFPNFGIPSGQVLTTFQSAITDSVAPFVYLSNCVEVTII